VPSRCASPRLASSRLARSLSLACSLSLFAVLVPGCASTLGQEPPRAATASPSSQPATRPAATAGAGTQDRLVGVDTRPGYPGFVDPEVMRALLAGENRASPAGRLVLETGRRMTVVERFIHQGACWDYADAIYRRAGFAGRKRATVFSHGKRGPYATPAQIQPGDFLSYLKDASDDSVHSAIFVEWLPRDGDRAALMLTYPGGRIPVPGHYGTYVLTRVYRVMRPRP